MIDLLDPRRLAGAIEESLYRLFSDGHTICSHTLIRARLNGILAGSPLFSKDGSLLNQAIAWGIHHGCFVQILDGLLQLPALLLMEVSIARSVAARLVRDERSHVADIDYVEAVISDFAATQRIVLTTEQKNAIHLAARSRLGVITGEVWGGKTDVLMAIYELYDIVGVRVFPMAVAGRAASRMAALTSRPASTIATFLSNISAYDLSGNAAVVIHDASLLDVMTMSKLFAVLPLHCRVLLVGDSPQSMPTGPGLVMRELMACDGVPIAALTEQRFVDGPLDCAASLVREGLWPELGPDMSNPVVFISCGLSDMPKRVVDLHAASSLPCQILTVKRNGGDGMKLINAESQARYTRRGKQLVVKNKRFDLEEGAGFYLSDLVRCTKNRWELGIPKGLLGKVTAVYDQQAVRKGFEKHGLVLGSIEWDDGVTSPLYEDMLLDLELGYAITMHMAQGSQWPVVIVPVTANRLLDRTLICAAITSATFQVIFVGDEVAAKNAVGVLPKAKLRQTGLNSKLDDELMRLGCA